MGFVVYREKRGKIYNEVMWNNKKGGCVMIVETKKQDKQLQAEKTWLLYYNDVLYRSGIITAEAYHKMIHRINNRTSILAGQKRE